MNAARAREIIIQARTDEVYEGPVPEDDERAIAEAEGLVSMAETAWDQNVRGPEVEAILRIAAAAESENGHGAPSAEAEPPQVESGDGRGEPSSESHVEELQGHAEPAPEHQGEPEAPRAEAGGSDPEGESDSEGTPPPAEPDSEIGGSDYQAPVSEEDLTKVEPWEGYSQERVPSIQEALRLGVDADSDPEGFMAHVWAYEAAHKDRQRIFKTLEELAAELKEKKGEKLEEEPAPSSEESGQREDAEEPIIGDVPGTDEERGSADAEEGSGTDAEPEPEQEAPEPRGEDRPASHEADPPAEDGGSDSQGVDPYDELLVEIEQNLKRERLHVPPPITDDAPVIPFDLTTLTDSKLHELYGNFGAYAYRASYLLMREEAIARKCREAADELAHYLLVNSEKYDEHNKAKTMTVLEAEIEADANVKLWRKRQRKHEAFALAYRQERDAYVKQTDILSRLETMRHNEFERSGGMRKR